MRRPISRRAGVRKLKKELALGNQEHALLNAPLSNIKPPVCLHAAQAKRDAQSSVLEVVPGTAPLPTGLQIARSS